jgi:hypothetical protein
MHTQVLSGRHSTGSAASKQLRSGPNSDVLVYMTVSLSIAYRRLSRRLNNASDMRSGGTTRMRARATCPACPHDEDACIVRRATAVTNSSSFATPR